MPVVLLAGCGRKLAPQQARGIMQRVQEARRTLSVQGTLTTSINVRGQQLQADAEIHRAPGAIHLKYVSGRFAGWQIIEQDGLVWRVSPDGKPSPSPIGPEPGLGLPAQAGLEVSRLWPRRVAGRWVRRFAVVPTGQQVGRFVIALDARTFYPLQMQRYGPGGQLVSETTFREVQYGVAPPPRVTPPSVAQQHGQGQPGRGGAQTTEQDLVTALGGPLLKPTYVPQGLQLRGFYSRQTRRGVLAEMRYSDGLRTLVVAQLKIPDRRAGRPPHPQGTGPHPRERWQQRRNGEGPPGQGVPGQPGGWWQRWRSGGDQPQNPAGRMGRNLLRERRGDRVVIVGGDLAPEELRKVLNSIPYPPGQQPGTHI